MGYLRLPWINLCQARRPQTVGHARAVPIRRPPPVYSESISRGCTHKRRQTANSQVGLIDRGTRCVVYLYPLAAPAATISRAGQVCVVTLIMDIAVNWRMMPSQAPSLAYIWPTRSLLGTDFRLSSTPTSLLILLRRYILRPALLCRVHLSPPGHLRWNRSILLRSPWCRMTPRSDPRQSPPLCP